MKHSGYVIYEGPSELTGDPIVAIVTIKSKNSATGNMAQLWILAADADPVTAAQSGADESICGNCVLRPINEARCYVNLGQAPLAVYRAWRRGIYPLDLIAAEDALRGRKVRLGAYGDPAAVPVCYLEYLLNRTAGHTGYTHAWRNPALSYGQLRGIHLLCMASVESAEDALIARELGWRTFRVRTRGQESMRHEFPCLKEYSDRTCEDCMACRGSAKSTGASVVIFDHGPKARRRKFDLDQIHA